MTGTSPELLTKSIRSVSIEAGFDLVGFAPAISPSGMTRFEEWLDSGYEGEMSYLSDRIDAYRHPRSILEGVCSIAMLALVYKSADPTPSKIGHGKVATYASSGIDYHDAIHEKLKWIRKRLSSEFPGLSLRGVVDTAPLLEREFAQIAGLGWFGKNTMLISKTHGSYFFLAAILVDQQLVYDQAFETSHCGSCTACLSACPTDAFVEAGVLDARRCISYLTIEHRGSIPDEFREGIGDWLFGCDVCQEVCPWNRKPVPTTHPEFKIFPDLNSLELESLFELSEEQFRSRFRKTPLWRAKRRGILRNAAIVLGNQKNEQSIPALAKGLNDDEWLVRATCAWAIGQFGPNTARATLLKDSLCLEKHPNVREELDAALKRIQ